MKDAYLQLQVDDESKELLTINTHKGLFRYNRLLFGTASSPPIFQHSIKQIGNGNSGVCVCFDDMIITGPTTETHVETLDKCTVPSKTNGLAECFVQILKR